MAVVQTVYNTDFAVGYAGMVANQEPSNRISRTIEDVAGIGFGKAAFQGAGDHGITATPAAGDFLGITIAHYAPEPNPANGQVTDNYPRYADVPLLNRGAIWVVTGVNVAPRDPVYVTPAGVFTNVNGGGANFALDGWSYDITALASAMALIVRR